jgi:hypothetical protein
MEIIFFFSDYAMALWKSIGSIYLLTWLIHWTSFWLVKRNSSGYFRAHVMHLEHVIKVELLMILGSFFIWKRVTSLFLESITPKQQKDGDDDGESTKGKRPSYRQSTTQGAAAKSKHLRLIVFSILAVFLFLAHFSQFLNYFANSVEPRLISWVCLTSFGM